MAIYKKRTGFSLIEVNMAILVAAGGLLSLFSLFPSGLRQSVMARGDMFQATFAKSFFDAVSANISQIEDPEEWDDIPSFWDSAIEGTGIKATSSGLKKVAAAKTDSNLSEASKELFDKSEDPAMPTYDKDNMYYVYRESDAGFTDSGSLSLPPQFLIRVLRIGPLPNQDPPFYPCRYVISLVSTDQLAPAIYHRNAVYTSEFYYSKRP